MLAVVFVLAATLTLLPAALGKLGPPVDAERTAVGARGRASLAAFGRWGERLWRQPPRFGDPRTRALIALGTAHPRTTRPAMPSIKVVPNGDPSRQGYQLVQQAFGTGAPGVLQIVRAERVRLPPPWPSLHRDTGIARVLPTQIASSRHLALIEAVPKQDPSKTSTSAR